MLLNFIINKMKISRSTKQKELLKKEIKAIKTFFDAEELLKKAQQHDTNIGIATVYRFLKEQTKQGSLHAYQCDRRTIYSKQRQHCHYTCQKTGKTEHFTVDSIDFLKHKLPGSIVSFQIEVTGMCEECKTNPKN